MEKKPKKPGQRLMFISLGVFIALVAIVAIAGDKKDEQPDSSDAVLEAMNKCTVMEAADLMEAGAGKYDYFDMARKTCENAYEYYEYTGVQDVDAQFVEDTEKDWETKKDKMIDGKSLPYYLELLTSGKLNQLSYVITEGAWYSEPIDPDTERQRRYEFHDDGTCTMLITNDHNSDISQCTYTYDEWTGLGEINDGSSTLEIKSESENIVIDGINYKQHHG